MIAHWQQVLQCRLHRAWLTLRQISGDDAFERYLAHAQRQHVGQAALTRREFYDLEMRRKWSGVNRCC